MSELENIKYASFVLWIDSAVKLMILWLGYMRFAWFECTIFNRINWISNSVSSHYRYTCHNCLFETLKGSGWAHANECVGLLVCIKVFASISIIATISIQSNGIFYIIFKWISRMNKSRTIDQRIHLIMYNQGNSALMWGILNKMCVITT